jgi:hypothetical protein
MNFMEAIANALMPTNIRKIFHLFVTQKEANKAYSGMDPLLKE